MQIHFELYAYNDYTISSCSCVVSQTIAKSCNNNKYMLVETFETLTKRFKNVACDFQKRIVLLENLNKRRARVHTSKWAFFGTAPPCMQHGRIAGYTPLLQGLHIDRSAFAHSWPCAGARMRGRGVYHVRIASARAYVSN